MELEYSHEQFGKLVVGIMVPFIGLLLALFVSSGAVILLWLTAFGLTVLLLFFYSLRVEVTREHVNLRFGIGLVRKRFDVADIVEAFPVRNRWWYGFGIRLTPHGWLFNVSGLDAVQIVLRSGRHYRIGTDEPEELARAVRAVIQAG